MLKILARGLVPLVVLGGVSCTANAGMPDTGKPDTGKPASSRYCTREYNPVCGRRGHDLQTFANRCEARRAGYRVIEPAPCRSTQEDYGKCGNEYAPVCATNGKIVRTMRNQCIVNSSGYWIVHEGRC